MHFSNVHETWAFSKKKHEYHRLVSPEIIYAERRGYLNVWKVLLQNTIR